MRLKSVLYEKEQNKIMKQVIDILELDDENSITLHELDTNPDKQKKLLDLIPIIRKYFSFSCIMGVREPEKIKRPYLSIIKHISKLKYKIITSDHRIKLKDKIIRTKKYYFI